MVLFLIFEHLADSSSSRRRLAVVHDEFSSVFPLFPLAFVPPAAIYRRS